MLVWLYPVNISEGIAETVTMTYREGGVPKDFTGYSATWRIIQEGAVWASGTATLATGLISVPLSAAQTAIPKPTKAQKLNASAVLEVTATNGGVTIVFNATVTVARREDSEGGTGILSSAAPSTPPPNGKATPQHFGAIGDGINDDRPAFAALNTWGGDAYIPKPPVAYNVSSPINLDRVGITVDPTASWEALTDSGNITWNTNLFTQDNPPVPVHRFNGRAFFGDAAHEMAGGWVAGGGTTDDRGTASWYAKDTPIFGGYTARDATAVIANGKGTVALALSARSSQQWNAAWQAPIGLAVFMQNDGNAAGADSSAWGIIVEGRQTRAGRRTFAMEVALGNTSGVAVKPTPYNVYATPTNGGVIGIWMAGGGDASISSPSTAPNAAAMVVLKGITNTGLASGWETGIVFGPDALTGTDGTSGSGTFADAVSMCRNQAITWHEPTTDAKAFSITSRYTTATDATRLEAYASGGVMGLRLSRQSTNQTLLDLRNVSTNTTTTATLQAETGLVRLAGEGSAANVDVFLDPKGTGRVRFGTRTASGDVPVTGYIEILDQGGNVRRLAVVG